MKTFDILREGDFVYNPTDGDALKCVMEDYYRTGEKIPCLCDENYIWPVSEICADDYKLLHRFEEKDVVSIKWVSEYTAVIKMMDKTIWLATRQPCKDGLELSHYLFDSGAVLFYYDEEKEYHGVKCNGRVTYFTKEEFAEY